MVMRAEPTQREECILDVYAGMCKAVVNLAAPTEGLSEVGHHHIKLLVITYKSWLAWYR